MLTHDSPNHLYSRPATFRCRGGRTPARYPSARMTGRSSFAGQLPSCALMDALSITIGDVRSIENVSTRKGEDMGIRGPSPKLADVVLEEAEDVDNAAARVLRLLTDARKDGVITAAEADDILVAARQTLIEARQMVEAAERASVADSLADNIKRGGITAHVAKRAREIGGFDNMLMFPTRQPDPQTAA